MIQFLFLSFLFFTVVAVIITVSKIAIYTIETWLVLLALWCLKIFQKFPYGAHYTVCLSCSVQSS